MPLAFVGQSLALSAAGLAAASDGLCVSAAEIWTVLSVETAGCGFLPDRRPPILFERHIFSRLTNHRFDTHDVSNPEPGGYGCPGAPQYQRLAAAIEFHRGAALQSASWGLAQILGSNFVPAGFGDVESMVAAMTASEDAQLAAFTKFLRSNCLDQSLKAHDWTALARGYNGPNFAINQYDVKLAKAFQKYSCGPTPDLQVRAAQLYLTFAGLNPGPIDGIMGAKTGSALLAYQQQKGLALTARADPATLAALLPDAEC
ncbi:MAG TPA: N-acetylmuramidase domain-containing protein [Bryobacteraceae bacterium]|jgi:hypothetical protein